VMSRPDVDFCASEHPLYHLSVRCTDKPQLENFFPGIMTTAFMSSLP
jgi:hypothetical protein